MATTNVLITGAKSGIGKGILTAYASQPNTVVIAAIRDDPTSAKAEDLVSSVTNIGKGSKVIVVPYDAAAQTDTSNVVQHLRSHHPDITHLDVVIANAAVSDYWGPCHSIKKNDLATHLAVNTIAPILLYIATRDLLLAAPEERTPKFFFVSSIIGSITVAPTLPLQMPVMGLCKAADNFFAAKANQEEDRLVVVPVHPGWVQTKMGNAAAEGVGMGEAPMTIERSIELLMGIFDTVGKDQGGKFLQVEGDVVPW